MLADPENSLSKGWLPEGWDISTLGKIGDYLNGRAFKVSEWTDKGRPIIRIQDLTGSRNNPNHFKGEVEERYLVQPGDLLISWAATLGAYIWSGTEGVLNQHIFKVISHIDKQFHYYLVRHFLDELYRHTHGSGMVHITKGRFDDTRVPLPPLAEQRRIVEKVEALLERVGGARDRLAKVPAILKRFRQSVLAAACSGRLTEDWRSECQENQPASFIVDRVTELRRHRNITIPVQDRSDDEPPDLHGLPSGWSWCQVWQVATVYLGGTPSRKDATCWGGEIPWVSSGEVANCRITETKEQITAEGLANSNAKLYPPGTVLIAMIGEGKTRGQAAILDIEACTNQNVAGLVFDSGEVVPEYIWQWALSEYEGNRSSGRGGAQPALNGQKVRTLWLPLAPFNEQHEIVRRVEALFKLADTSEQRVAAGTARTEKLTQAILAKAFRGELVPTEAELAHQEGRDYEPASVLLERIRAERAASGGDTPAQRSRRSRTRRNGRAEPSAAADSGSSAPRRREPTAVETTSSTPPRRAERPERNGEPMCPVPVDPTDRNEMLAVIREVFSTGGTRDRETALRDVAAALGYQRLGSSIRGALDNDLRTAVRRGILENDGGLSLLCRSIEQYTRDHLIDMLLAAMGTGWWEQADAIRAAARHLGFRRTGSNIEQAFRSAINGAIRRGLLERDGTRLRRLRSSPSD